MYCEKCGQQLPDHATFCGKCGARISEGTNYFQVQEEKPARTATNNSGGIRRRTIGLCLLVGVIIVGGFFFLRRDSEEIQNVESNLTGTLVDGSVAGIIDVKDILEEVEVVERVVYQGERQPTIRCFYCRYRKLIDILVETQKEQRKRQRMQWTENYIRMMKPFGIKMGNAVSGHRVALQDQAMERCWQRK